VAALGVAVVALLLMFLLRDVVRQALAPPITYAAWLVGLVLQSIPQSTTWALLVAVGVIVAWRSLGIARVLAGLRRKDGPPILADSTPQSTLAARRADLARLHESRYAREKMAFEMRGLLVQVLAQRERQSSSEIERRIRTRELPVPAEVRDLVLDWQNWLAGPDVAPPTRLQRFIDRLMYTQFARESRTAFSPAEARLSRVLDYLDRLSELSARKEERKK
jgi:hypothetical protein